MSAHRHIHSSESNEWRTPLKYVVAARAVMGSIDLDPATSAEANKHIQATSFFTKEVDGLSRPWHGNVWLNPPYGRDTHNRSNQETWSRYLQEQYDAGHVAQAVLLVNAVPDRRWFWPLWDNPICFVRKRIQFISMDGAQKHQPTHGNAFVYFGPRSGYRRFSTGFETFGHVVMPCHGS